MIETNVNNEKKDDHPCIVPNIHNVEPRAYEAYIKGAWNLVRVAPDISRITHELIEGEPKFVANKIFAKLLGEIEDDLSNPNVGIAVVDIPESSRYSSTDDAFWGVSLSLALGSNVFSLDRDRVNNTPYTVYAASYKKSKKLTDFGLQPIAPETKLGFHTDGVLTNGEVTMPINIMLYNICIEYRKPGNFYWVPFSKWRERDLHMDRIGVGRPYNIKVTPSVYEVGNNQLEMVLPQQVTTPIFVSTESFGTTLYLNGNVVSAADELDFDLDAIDDLRRSLATNATRFAVPQKTRRLIFARNVLGAHARDIFEEPNFNAPYTRVFLRSVDTHCIRLMGADATMSCDHEK